MNYNQVQDLIQLRRRESTTTVVPTARDIKQAELAMNIMGHPAWDAFHIHLQELLQDTRNTLEEIKDRWATSLSGHDDRLSMHQQAMAYQARINTLKEIMDYLPNLIKKVQ